MSDPRRCAHCGAANVIPWVEPNSCQLQGAMSLNGTVSICCRCLREFNAMAAQHVRMLTKKRGK